LEIRDSIYRGREDFVYRLTVGELPFVTNIFPLGAKAGASTEVQFTGWNLPVKKLSKVAQGKEPGIIGLAVDAKPCGSNSVPFAVDDLPECVDREPNNAPDKAQAVKLPTIVNGRIDQPDDVDAFRFEGREGQKIVAEVYGRRLDSPLDSLLRLTDSSGKELAQNDDCENKAEGLLTHHADSRIIFTLPATGAYYVHLSDTQHKGGPEYAYRLRISEPRPDFELRATPSSVDVRSGGSAPITVYALRKDGYTGPIEIRLKDSPEGFSLSGAVVPEGQESVRVTVSGPASGVEVPASLRLEGRAEVDGRQIVHPVVPAEDMMQAFAYRHLVPCQELRVAVSGRPGRGMISVVEKTPIKIPMGGTASIGIGSSSGKLLDKVHLELEDPPEGISLKEVTSADGRMNLIVESDPAKAKVGLKGNLIVAAYPSKPAPTKGKVKTSKPRPTVATSSAIPFEVVER
jgi:hypothetical protein